MMEMEPPTLFLTLLCYTTTMSLSLPLFAQISSSMTVPLIFPNSPESPLYQKNLTRTQTITWLLHRSTNRARSLLSSTTSPNTVNLTQRKWASRGELRNEEGSIVLKLGVGTFDTPISYNSYYVFIDTGSELTWLQCEDGQNPPDNCYPNSKSSSYHPIRYGTHDLCYEGQSVGGICSYTKHYYNGATTGGILAIERFTFTNVNDDINTDTAFNLVFGCNHFHSGITISPDETGVLGLGWGPRSFISQMKTQAHHTFSYCFPHYEETALGSRGYFKLGSDGDSYDGFSSTALRRYQDIQAYYLNLEGISVNQQRLTIDPRIFVRNNDEGGTFIDSGSDFSLLVSAAYNEVKRVLQTYFESHGNDYAEIQPGTGGEYQMDLCYTSQRPQVSDLPSITLHFMGGADLLLNSNNVFIWLDDPPSSFCLAFKASEDKWTILGAYQQSNYRFIFDRSRMLLLFKQEDCHQGP